MDAVDSHTRSPFFDREPDIALVFLDQSGRTCEVATGLSLAATKYMVALSMGLSLNFDLAVHGEPIDTTAKLCTLPPRQAVHITNEEGRRT